MKRKGGDKPKRVALYSRVSTDQQDTGSQIGALEEWADGRGFEVVARYEDRGISGSVSSRPQLNKLMADAKRGKFDAVLVYAFDRFARSLKHLVLALDEFDEIGVAFLSYRDNVDTSTATGRLMFQLVGAMAEFERTLIRERTRAGLANARRKGKHIGRPADDAKAKEVVALRRKGMSMPAIAAEVFGSRERKYKVWRILQRNPI